MILQQRVSPSSPMRALIFDGDGDVDFSGFLGFAGSFSKSDPIYDIDASGLVDFTDFLVFAESFRSPF
ncbi:MAG: hypothetical protein VX910_13490 [Candidatus Latescibacterota bacterium]|nr:hypothetical protein [Candidatus Latescibacterota bacterium]